MNVLIKAAASVSRAQTISINIFASIVIAPAMVPRKLLILQHLTRSLLLLLLQQAYQYLHPAFQALLKPIYERHYFHLQIYIISTGISSTTTSPAYKRGYVISSIYLLRQFTPSHEHNNADIDYERSHHLVAYDPFSSSFLILHHRSLNTTLFSTPCWCTYDQYKNLLLPFLLTINHLLVKQKT